jgi:hypothetical protein
MNSLLSFYQPVSLASLEWASYQVDRLKSAGVSCNFAASVLVAGLAG